MMAWIAACACVVADGQEIRQAGVPGANCCFFNTTGKTLPLFRSNACCLAPFAKIFLFPKFVTYDLTKPSRPQEGRLAIVTIRWCGLRWTRRVARRAACRGRSSRVVLIPRRWDQACRDDRQATGANKPGTPGRARSSRKEPSRRECRSDFGVPVLACVRRFRSARKAVGAFVHPAFPAPSFRRGTRICKTRTRNRAAGLRLHVFSAVVPGKRGESRAPTRDP